MSVNVNAFKISKYVLTNELLYNFIKNNGYSNRKYWSHSGWLWKKINKIELPKWWVNSKHSDSKDIEIKLMDFQSLKNINSNLPTQYLSYYEAEVLIFIMHAFRNRMGICFGI